MRFRDMAVWFFKMAAGRHLEFCPTGNGAVGSAVPENPTLEPNMRGIGWRVEELWPFQIFPKCVNWPWGRSSVVGRQYSYFLHWSHILLFRYVSERGVYASFYVKCKKRCPWRYYWLMMIMMMMMMPDRLQANKQRDWPSDLWCVAVRMNAALKLGSLTDLRHAAFQVLRECESTNSWL